MLAPTLEECVAAAAYNRVNEGLLEAFIMDMTFHASFADQRDHEDRKATKRERLKEPYGGLKSEDVVEAFRVY
ncbi:MAG: hypothetical protein M2R45_02503 [Verrucomicrobia subdivision 3 bacterium]|nr:hypothetical protein [Limisphaerales bacterium]MCS1413293.1 hypothetical protein [Limisphaerales bacterium]